jgi:phosphatidylserine decarboxylase
MPLWVWNRRQSKYEQERVYGWFWMRILYQTALGRIFLQVFLTRSWVSRCYGFYQSSFLSRWKIARFIREFQIDMEDFEPIAYSNFNAFFIRKFRPGARIFTEDPKLLPAFAEGRYFVYEKVEPQASFVVKGMDWDVLGLLQDTNFASSFFGGPLLLARLCPVDYHRFHFPDDGEILASYAIAGRLHSVNPMPLQVKPDIFLTNQRQVSILQTRNFGKLAYVEVGALCVGKIVNHLGRGAFFWRGQEKGYFLFGGSTVIVLGEPGRFLPDADLIRQTQSHRETWLRLGEPIASCDFH